MRNYRMTSARRAALRKAQLASARARKGHGRTKYVTIAGRRVNRNKLIRNVAIGTAAAAVVGYNVNYHRKYVTGYHSTSIDSARIIRKTRSWQGQTHVRGTEGKPGDIWFSTRRWNTVNFGPRTVRVRKIPKSAITSHRQTMRAYASGVAAKKPGRFTPQEISALGKSHEPTWFSVSPKVIEGKRVYRAGRPISETIIGGGAYTKFGRGNRKNVLEMGYTAANATGVMYTLKHWKNPGISDLRIHKAVRVGYRPYARRTFRSGGRTSHQIAIRGRRIA